MHARLQELIGLRDGEPVGVDVAQHVADCKECRSQLARLTRLGAELRQLPGFQPPPRSWPAIERKLKQPPPPRRQWLSLSTAAGLSAFAVLALLWSSVHRQEHSPQSDDKAQTGEAVAQLVARSQQLEAFLQELPRRPAVERAVTAATIDELQTRIQMLDLRLSAAQESGLDRTQAQGLWSDRVQLLNSLVGVRYAEAARGSYSPANIPANISGAI